jgi:hypothetical protein
MKGSSSATAPWNNEQVVYVTQHDSVAHDDEHEQDAELVRAVIRAIQRSPRLHAELRLALEHKI